MDQTRKYRDGMRTVEQLWHEMRSAVSPFPDGVVDVPEPMSGTAFFPGGVGVWLPDKGVDDEFSIGQIMVVG